jgi:hypothetical protein
MELKEKRLLNLGTSSDRFMGVGPMRCHGCAAGGAENNSGAPGNSLMEE